MNLEYPIIIIWKILPVSDNDWEQIKRGGDKAIQNWIDAQLKGKSCTIVLISARTAGLIADSYSRTKTPRTQPIIVVLTLAFTQENNILDRELVDIDALLT